MSRLNVDRKHSFSGRENLAWFFANRKWIRGEGIVEAAWAKRPLPVDDRSSNEAGIRFLLLASKKSYKRAHDRNKIKRWLRAAIHEVPEFAEIEATLSSEGRQAIIMLRISKPVEELKWSSILENMQSIAATLQKRL